MLALHQRHEPIDTLTVADQLTRHGGLDRVGGCLAVDELAGWVPAAAHARSYARIVRDLAARRALLRACYEIQQHALEGHGSIDELLADASKRVGDLLDRSTAGARTRYWIAYLLSVEQTSTQAQLLFACALTDQQLLGPDGLSVSGEDRGSPVLVAWSDNSAEMTATDTRQFLSVGPERLSSTSSDTRKRPVSDALSSVSSMSSASSTALIPSLRRPPGISAAREHG